MERIAIIILLITCIALAACSDIASPGVEIMDKKISSSLIIKSPAFSDNTMMPRKYSCQGDDINPPLEFQGIPSNAKSLVLIVEDPDAPMGTWDHWVLFNIPIINNISEDSIPQGALQASNSWGNNSYGGPCPPSGTHRYMFRLYALDTMLSLDESANKSDVESAMQGHVIAQALLTGLYQKT